MKLIKACLVCGVVLLSACNAAGVKPDSAETADANTPAEQPSAINPDRKITNRSPQKTKAPVEEKSPSDMDMLSNRLMSVQEHVLQLKTQTSELQQVNRALLGRLQAMQEQLNVTGDAVSEDAQTNTNTSTDDLNGMLDQITMMVNEMGNQVQDGAFRVVTAYTAKGQWVLIRYHRYTGETWLADQGQWNLLEESSQTGTSEYEVVLLRADKDVKGYVASRIDRVSGDTWWLKQNTWQPYIDN